MFYVKQIIDFADKIPSTLQMDILVMRNWYYSQTTRMEGKDWPFNFKVWLWSLFRNNFFLLDWFSTFVYLLFSFKTFPPSMMLAGISS